MFKPTAMRKILTLLAFSAASVSFAQTPGEPAKSSFAKNFPYLSMGEWKPGMKFITEPPSQHNLSVEIDLVPYMNKKLTTLRLMQGDYQGKVFVFTGYETRRQERCAEDDCNKTYLVFESDGKKYEYSSFFSMGAVKEYTEASVTGLVYYDEVEKCQQLLKDQKLYTLDVPWFDGVNPKPVMAGKFQPITITDIGVGTQDGPVKISFKPEGEDKIYYVNTRLSGINKATGEFGVDFDKAFTFDDPRQEFPGISDEHWHTIQHRKVQTGMTKHECNLAWGKPDKVSSTNTNGLEVETWTYGLSRSVTFKNGIVDAFTE